MGYQQLLLLVCAAGIVGSLILVGIHMFNENAVPAEEAALVQGTLDIASKAQTWNERGAALGGGDNSFQGLTLEKLGVSPDSTNGHYSLEVLSDDEVKITGNGHEGSRVEVTVSRENIKLEKFSGAAEKVSEVEANTSTDSPPNDASAESNAATDNTSQEVTKESQPAMESSVSNSNAQVRMKKPRGRSSGC